MAKRTVAKPQLSPVEKQIAEKFNISVGPDRFDFLNRFPLVRKSLDTYVTICAIRLKVTDTSEDLLPDDEVMDLPHNDAFLRTYFGGSRFQDFNKLVKAADRVSRRVATISAAAAIRGTQIIQHGGLSGDSKATERLVSAYQAFVVILFNLILFINRRGESNLKAERGRIKNQYIHHHIYKDILGLLIDLDARSHGLVTMQNGNDHGTFAVMIEDLGKQAQQVHSKILEACVAQEIIIYNNLSGNSRAHETFSDRLISIAIETQTALEKNKPLDPTIPLEAASEVIELLTPATSKARCVTPSETAIPQQNSPKEKPTVTAGQLAAEYDCPEIQRSKL